MPLDLAAIAARYQRTGTGKPLWQEVCADVGALLAEVERLRAALTAAHREIAEDDEGYAGVDE